MDIDGLMSRASKGGAFSKFLFTAENGPSCLEIEVLCHEEGTAMIQFLEDGVNPGLESSEKIALANGTDALIERCVRFMAVTHMHVREATNAFVTVDAVFLSRGFFVAFDEEHNPAWMKMSSKGTIIVKRKDSPGLPGSSDDLMEFVYVQPSKRKIVADIDSVPALEAILDKENEFLEGGGNQDRYLGLVYSHKGKTLH